MSALARDLQPKLSADEFLAWEREQSERHELVDGRVVMKVGGTLAHAEIALNLAVALRAMLLPRGCKVYASDVKVRAEGDVFYPDVMVACGPRDPAADLVVTPVLLAEVFSRSTRATDRDKWRTCQRLRSLQSFLLVEQERVCVEVFRRRGGEWFYSSYAEVDAVIELQEPALALRVGDLYAGIEGLDPSLPRV